MFLTFFCIFIVSLASVGTKTYLLRLVVPELLLVLAYHLGHNELHLLQNCHLREAVIYVLAEFVR